MHRVDNSTATKSGWTGTGNTSIGSAVISSIADTTGIRIGNYVSVSSGFADIGRLRVIAKGASSITVDRNATAAATGATITALAGMYTDGVSGEEARTTLNSKHLNEIQEEIANVIESADIALAAGNTKQLSSAVVLTKKTSQTIDGAITVTGQTQLTNDDWRSKRFNDGVFGTKSSSIDITSSGAITDLTDNKLSVNLGTPTNDDASFKAKYDGYYRVGFTANTKVNNSTAELYNVLMIYKNGSMAAVGAYSVAIKKSDGGDYCSALAKSIILHLNAGDEVSLFAEMYNPNTSIYGIHFTIEMVGG